MAKEKDTHEALMLLFHRYVVPSVMVMDGAKAHIQGGFRHKLREAGCHIKQTDTHTHTHIECSRRFYQGTETRRWARNGQVWGTKEAMG
jgi:hypothetical protein